MTTFVTNLRCVNCQAEYSIDNPPFEGCPSCKTNDFISSVSAVYDYEKLSKIVNRDFFTKRSRDMGVWRFHELLPVRDNSHRISLGEGSTPLVRCQRTARELKTKSVYVKDEGRNPTFSFKDRHAAVSVSMALEQGANAVTIATSGNHGAAMAAYAAKVDLPAVIFTYPGYYQTMRTLIQIYGAYLFVTDVEGRWALMREGMKNCGWYPIGNMTIIPSLHPFGHEGYKPIAYEICEDLNWNPPDYVFVPNGFSEAFYGIWKGFKELKQLGLVDHIPCMVSTEPATGGPLSEACEREEPLVQVDPELARTTLARGVACSRNSLIGWKAVQESGGKALKLTDDEILLAQKEMAHEGVFAECTAAIAFAGLKKLAKKVNLDGAVSVVISSSCGLKDYTVISGNQPEPPVVSADFESFKKIADDVYGVKFVQS
jgi:threonine synthase